MRFKYRGCGTEIFGVLQKKIRKDIFLRSLQEASLNTTLHLCYRGEMCEHCWRIVRYWLPAEYAPTVTCSWHVMKRPLSLELWSKPQQCTTILTIQNQFSNSLPILALWYNKFIVQIAFFVRSVHNFYTEHLKEPA